MAFEALDSRVILLIREADIYIPTVLARALIEVLIIVYKTCEREGFNRTIEVSSRLADGVGGFSVHLAADQDTSEALPRTH